MVKSGIDFINYCNHDDLGGDFFLLLSNRPKGIIQLTATALFKYGSSIVREENFVQNCISDDFNDFCSYNLRYSINSFLIKISLTE